MLNAVRKILVQVDSAAGVNPALDRALQLAGQVGASVKIVDAADRLPRHARLALPEAMQSVLLGDRQSGLGALAARAAESAPPGVAVTAELLRGQPAIAVVREVLRHGHDLVLRSRTIRGGEPAYDAVGMQLFRKCPCPVLLVGVHATRRRRVLAAVAPNPDDPVEQTLNRKILELTVFLAEKEGHEPHVLHVWEPFGEELLKSHTTEAEVEAYIEAARQTARAELDEVLAPFTGRIAGAHVHLERGEPGAFIPDFVGRHGIDLVVMGSVARTGIAGFVMGNTAEHVLSSLTCSVLAVKPDGFECPVRLE